VLRERLVSHVEIRDVGDLPGRSEVGDQLVLLSCRAGKGVVDHNSAHVDVVVGSCRTVDDHRPSDSFPILRHRVSMIPAILQISPRFVTIQAHASPGAILA